MWLCTYIFNIFLFTHNVTVLSSYRPHDGVYIFPICCPLSPRLHCDWLVSSDWLVCRQTGRQRQSVAWGQWAGRWGFIRLVSRHGKAQHGIRVTWSLLAHLTQCVLTQGSVCERESVLVFFVCFFCFLTCPCSCVRFNFPVCQCTCCFLCVCVCTHTCFRMAALSSDEVQITFCLLPMMSACFSLIHE